MLGGSSPTDWAQVLSLPRAVVVVEIHDTEGGARRRGMALLSELSRNLAEPPATLKELEKIVRAAATAETVTLAVIVPVGTEILSVLAGRGSVYLRRGERMAEILAAAGSVSGSAVAGDTIVVVSGSFAPILTPEELAPLFDHLPAEAVAERITLAIHRKPKTAEEVSGTGEPSGAAGIVRIGQFVPEDVSPREQSPEHEIRGPRNSLPRVFRSVLTSGTEHRALGRIRRHPPVRALGLIVIAAASILLFIAVVALGLRAQQSSRENSGTRLVLSEVRRMLDESQAVRELNPGRSRELLRQARDTLAPLTVSRSGMKREIDEMNRQVTAALTDAMRVYAASPPALSH